jgi:hypothetical protein
VRRVPLPSESLTREECQAELDGMTFPPFVHSVQLSSSYGWASIHGYNADFAIQVKLIDGVNPYKDENSVGSLRWTPITNNPFRWPKTREEFRLQVMAAIMMGTSHEIFEMVSDAGRVALDVHHFPTPRMSSEDTDQWMFMLNSLRSLVGQYAEMLPPKVLEDA